MQLTVKEQNWMKQNEKHVFHPTNGHPIPPDFILSAAHLIPQAFGGNLWQAANQAK